MPQGPLLNQNINYYMAIKFKVIELSEIKLFKKDGTLVKDFGTFYKEYADEFKADAACWCIYLNSNEMLKDFNTHLIEKIRNDMAELPIAGM
jgi:hypothetical protein